MGQKTHPTGFRVGVIQPWSSTWYAKKSNYPKFLVEDAKIRKYIKENGPANKGKHGTQEFRDKCRQSALNRWRNHKKETCSDKSERVD